MIRMQFISFVLLIVLVSCNRSNSTGKVSVLADSTAKLNDSSQNIDSNKNVILDINQHFEVDDYPVTNDMFSDSTNDSYKKKVDSVFSLDKAWFTNKQLNQTLVFELYTDYHRLEIFHFMNNDIPNDLIRKLSLDVSRSKFDNVFDTATFEQKAKSIQGFINSSIQINKSYFITKKGFQLGDNEEKAIRVYGKPDKKTIQDNVENLYWEFLGDYIFCGDFVDSSRIKKNTKPIAKCSFGYEINMFFRNNKLIGVFIMNDIP